MFLIGWKILLIVLYLLYILCVYEIYNVIFLLLLFCYLMKKYFFKNFLVDGFISRKKNYRKKYIICFVMVIICIVGGIYYIKLSEKKKFLCILLLSLK